ncbi:hypothetical protein K450DRAFT_223103 [Umbelopsis ramanniana AG]|uniref:Uncharacterized protein n=1 Tax=Umbelopsis ramanniana AG TaxID=1314678 RepID=A0AAD5EGY5_UMBRA|nr:uncharacterized protein K450DRAFT_223103 [Umbelopsis ramanniana AG]KAI8583329.1 hypothetical protein K450DRAFT_223103 [Umbelopsis ramanniana AG]
MAPPETGSSVDPTTAEATESLAASKTTAQPSATNLDSGPVQAYAKLEGDEFCYYIRTLQVTLGRKGSKNENVDIPLGATKSVSRQHARLFYNFTTQRFEMMVFGKNGAFVNEHFVEKGVTVPLENRTKIQIGEVAFLFLLPRMDLEEPPQTESMGYIATPQQLENKTFGQKNTANGADAAAKEDSVASDEMNDVDSQYNNKDTKPPYSYASLIAQAINSTVSKKMTLNGIYNYITTHYPYYQMAQNGWQNSIRHNLSLNKAFVKVPRGDSEPGKGAFWTIDSAAESQFTNGVYKRNRRTGSKTPTPTSYDTNPSKRKIKREDTESEDQPAPKKAQTEASVPTPPSSANTTATTSTTTTKAAPAPSTTASSTTTKAPAASNTSTPAVSVTSAYPTPQSIQAQLQVQLQNTIRQHLLDPVRHPLPASIAQLLPQAIAQLPPQLASQLSATLQSALRQGAAANNANKATNSATTTNATTLAKANTTSATTATVTSETAKSNSPTATAPKSSTNNTSTLEKAPSTTNASSSPAPVNSTTSSPVQPSASPKAAEPASEVKEEAE